MAAYEFVTVWTLDAPIEAVWGEISDSERWPEWWQGVESVVELEKGDERGIGSVRRFTWKSKLPYRLAFDMRTTRIEPLAALEGEAFGELQGKGLWTFTREGGRTVARYDWRVETTKPWMNLLSPVARPLFSWNHDVVMGWGEEGLKRRLAGRLAADSANP
jgi:hypothetical protein